jgi:hypothetical protein
MITCTTCKHEEYFGALYCSACGAQLNYQAPTPTKTAHYTNEPSAGAALKPAPAVETFPKPASKPLPETSVSLKVLDSGMVLPLEGGLEFTLGRVSGNQPILPDIDLTPYQAYEGGVSRLHSTIKIEKTAVTVTDLGSANGTRVNGKKISPHTPLPLENGDIISMGKFKLQVLIRL